MVGSLLLETIYTFIIVVCCYIIQRHARQLSQLSGHQGISCFQKAFAYWGFGFLLRYVFTLGKLFPTLFGASSDAILTIISILFEYFIALGGFFLVYSLIWRQMEQKSFAFFAGRYHMLALHALAIAIALADVSLGTFHFLFIVQIIVLAYATLLTYDHWRTLPQKSVKNTFSSLYLCALVAALIGYIINYIAEFFIDQYPWIRIVTYLLTCSIFLIILFGVLRIVHSAAYCERCCPLMKQSKQQLKQPQIAQKSRSTTQNKHGKKTRKA